MCQPHRISLIRGWSPSINIKRRYTNGLTGEIYLKGTQDKQNIQTGIGWAKKTNLGTVTLIPNGIASFNSSKIQNTEMSDIIPSTLSPYINYPTSIKCRVENARHNYILLLIPDHAKDQKLIDLSHSKISLRNSRILLSLAPGKSWDLKVKECEDKPSKLLLIH